MVAFHNGHINGPTPHNGHFQRSDFSPHKTYPCMSYVEGVTKRLDGSLLPLHRP